MNSLSGYRFRNWAGNNTCVAKKLLQPASEEDLQEAINTSRKIGIVGSGHSFSPLCLNDDTLINLDLYNNVLSLDKEHYRIRVQAGIKLWQLSNFLDRHQLALTNLGSVSEQSIAGAVSTGTHGTGINFQILASQIEEFDIIKANGEKIEFHRERADSFNLCLVNLGALGVISQMTLNVVPAFRLREQSFAAKFDGVIERLEEFVYGTDHFRVWWFPPIDEVIVYRFTRTQMPPNDSRVRQWFMNDLVSVGVYRLALKIGNLNREWRRKINDIAVNKFVRPLDRTEKSFKVFNAPRPPKHRETEWAFDVRNAKEILREYKKMIQASKHCINYVQEVRFGKADEFALSPCYHRNTMWLGCYNADNFGWNDLLNDVETLGKQYQGRPHWGKEFGVDRDYIHKQYPLLQSFNTVRREYDPEGKFENAVVVGIL